MVQEMASFDLFLNLLSRGAAMVSTGKVKGPHAGWEQDLEVLSTCVHGLGHSSALQGGILSHAGQNTAA